MRFSLIPREEKFYDLFEEIARMLVEGADALSALFEDYKSADRYAGELKALEHRCDEAVANVLLILQRTFITPMDREDINSLATSLDTVLDNIEGTAYRAVALRIDSPTLEARRMAGIIRESVYAVQKAITLCRKQLASDVMQKTLRDVARLENDADDVYRGAVAQLFAHPPDSIELIKWLELYQWLENTADSARTVAHVVTGIVAKGL